MKGKVAFIAGAGVGYVLGARAGRGRFEKIKAWSRDALHDPRVQDAESRAVQFAKLQGTALKDKAVDVVKSKAGSTQAEEPAGTTEGLARAGGVGVGAGAPSMFEPEEDPETIEKPSA